MINKYIKSESSFNKLCSILNRSIRNSPVFQSLKSRIILLILFCLGISFLSSILVYTYLSGNQQRIDNSVLDSINSKIDKIVFEIRKVTNDSNYIGYEEIINNIITTESKFSDLNIYIVDLSGNIVLKSDHSITIQTDLQTIAKNAMNSGLEKKDYRKREEIFYVYNEAYSYKRIDFKDLTGMYVVMGGIVKNRANSIYGIRKDPYTSISFGLFAFLLLFYLLSKKKIDYISELAHGIFEISKGNLKYTIKEKSKDELGLLAMSINSMAQELDTRINSQKALESSKNELITNISHDLRTPLTSIMGYLRLIKDKKYENDKDLEMYINVANDKAEKLKTMVEDLFYFTKLENYDTKLFKEEVCLNELLEQLIEELIPIFESNDIKIINEISDERVFITADSSTIVRVFENLLTNAVKYSYKPGEIRISTYTSNEQVTTCIYNQGDIIPQDQLSLLFERMYTIDKSRSSPTAGSGLGLAIAKSIVKLHNGKIEATCKDNEICFSVQLPLCNSPS